MQAVIVAIAHVAQRDAVQGETKLLLHKTSDRDARRPLIGAESVSRLEVHAGQFFHQLDGTGTRRGALDLLGLDGLDLAAFTLAVDHHFFDFAGGVRGSDRIGGIG